MRRIMGSMLFVAAVGGISLAEFSLDPATYTDSYGDSLRVVEDYIAHISSGYWVRYDNVEFEENYNSISIEHGGENLGILDFFLDSLTGVHFASCSTEATGDWHVFTVDTYPMHGSFSGTHSIFIEFFGGDLFYAGVGNYRNFIFHEPDFEPPSPDTGVSKRYEPAAWGPIRKGTSISPRIITNLSASENMQQSRYEKTLAVYDVRGRTARLLTGSHDAGLGNGKQGGARQTLIVVPME